MTIWPSSAVVDSRLDPSGHPALRRDHVEGREPGVVDGAGGFDELFGPGDRLIIFDPEAEEPRVGGDGGGGVEVVVVGGPPKRGAQIGQLDGEPVYASRCRGLSHSARMSASRPAK